MTTLSYLVEAVRGDVDLPEDAAAVGAVNLRSLAGQVTQLGGALVRIVIPSGAR